MLRFVTVFPDGFIMICQFHVVKAIAKFEWDSTVSRSSSKKKKKGDTKRKKKQKKELMALPEDAKRKVLMAFRVAQRCRGTVDDPWAPVEQTFYNELLAICIEFNIQEVSAPLTEYFKKNWFCDEWRRKCLL